jgi:integrase
MRNHLKLTDIAVQQLKQSQISTTYWDLLLPAFGVRIGKHAKTFIVIDNKGSRTKLGRYPSLTLAKAREQARLVLTGGAAETLTYAEARRKYLDTETPKMSASHGKEVSRILSTNFADLDAKPLTALTAQHIVRVLDELAETKPSQACHVHSRIKTFFRWAQARSLIGLNPIEHLPPPAKQASRDRIFTDKELIAIYSAAKESKTSFGYITCIALHTGLRRANIAELEWDWISDDVITIPADAMKSEQPFLLPNLIQPILREMPRAHARYVFPSDAGTPISAFSKGKLDLEKRSKITDWGLHDCRRTFRSKLSEWRCCSPDIAEMLLAHSVGSSIRRTYDCWTYLPEKREALVRYDARLRALVKK